MQVEAPYCLLKVIEVEISPVETAISFELLKYQLEAFIVEEVLVDVDLDLLSCVYLVHLFHITFQIVGVLGFWGFRV